MWLKVKDQEPDDFERFLLVKQQENRESEQGRGTEIKATEERT